MQAPRFTFCRDLELLERNGEAAQSTVDEPNLLNESQDCSPFLHHLHSFQISSNKGHGLPLGPFHGIQRPSQPRLANNSHDVTGLGQVPFRVDLRDVGCGVPECNLGSFQSELPANFGGRGVAQLIGVPSSECRHFAASARLHSLGCVSILSGACGDSAAFQMQFRRPDESPGDSCPMCTVHRACVGRDRRFVPGRLPCPSGVMRTACRLSCR